MGYSMLMLSDAAATALAELGRWQAHERHVA
jgi:hypothetical protein